MAWKAEVQVLSSGQWVSNPMVFWAKKEAKGYGEDLSRDQPGVLGWRIVEVDDAVNYTWDKGTLAPFTGEQVNPAVSSGEEEGV